MTSLQQAYSFSKSQNLDLVFKGEMIADLQDVGKSPDEKQRFTILGIILIIESK